MGSLGGAPMAASTPCHHLLSGPRPQGASGQMGSGSDWPRPSSPLSDPPQDGHPAPVCHCPPGCPSVPSDPEVSPGASRSRPEMVQMIHQPPSTASPPPPSHRHQARRARGLAQLYIEGEDARALICWKPPGWEDASLGLRPGVGHQTKPWGLGLRPLSEPVARASLWVCTGSQSFYFPT